MNGALILLVVLGLLILGIIAISLIVLLIYLIPLFVQIRKTVTSFQQLADTLEKELTPTFAQIRNVTEEINKISRFVHSEVTKTEQVLANFRELANRAHKLALNFYESVELPILNLISGINSFRKGVRAFLNTLFSKQRKEGD